MPEVKVRAVAEPKATAMPELLTTVGAVPPGLDEAPEKISECEPAKVVTVLSFSSLAVIVRLSATETAGVRVAAAIAKWVAAPIVIVAERVELVALQERQTAVTV